MGTIETYPVNGRSASAYKATPEKTGPGVVVIQEWWGLNEQIKRVADRLAEAGFVALAPDLYHGELTRSPDEAGRLLMALNIEEAGKDLRGAVQYLQSLTGKPVGVVGFCMGGALSLFAACSNREAVGACVVYYGGHPKVSYDFSGLEAPVLGHWAEDDAFANANVPKLEEGFKAHGKAFEFHRYPGTRHAFCNDERKEVYHPEAAAKSWDLTLRFLRKNL